MRCIVDRKRNHSEEYRRRIERGLAKGLTRSEARGHPKSSRRTKVKPKSDDKIEAAVLAMNSGASLTTAARGAHVSPERLRYFIKARGLGRRKGQAWAMADKRIRELQFIAGSNSAVIRVRGFKEASEVARHEAAYRKAVDTGDFDPLRAFRGRGVRDLIDNLTLFETDPNELYRYAMRD
jgi:hypothetical protein